MPHQQEILPEGLPVEANPLATQGPEAMAGRGTDTVIAHLSLGEIVIPRAFLDDPDFMDFLTIVFESQGGNIAEFTVGDAANKINPETGYPEFGWFSKLFTKVRDLAQAAAVTVGNYFVPGSSILTSKLASDRAQRWLSGNLGQVAQLGGSLTGGGFGSSVTGIPASSSVIGSLPGSAAPLGTVGGKAIQGPLVSGTTAGGSGIAGSVGRTLGLTAKSLPDLGGLTGSLSGGGGSTFSPLKAIGQAGSGYLKDKAIDEAQDQILDANRRQLTNIESFDPSGITSDPGYQFNLEQGQRGLNRQLAAGGNLFSGRALKAASEYNQNYANRAFDNYYNRWLSRVGSQNQLYGNAGNVRGEATINRGNNLAQSLSNIFGNDDEYDFLRQYQQQGG